MSRPVHIIFAVFRCKDGYIWSAVRGAVVRYMLPSLPYGYGDLEPFADARTVQLHHAQYHQSYVDGLNATLNRMGGERHPQYISSILSDMASVPESERRAVAFFGGGFENHRMLWETMTPHDSSHAMRKPRGSLGDAIEIYFGGFESFQDAFVRQSVSVQGSGWCWLVLNRTYNRLEITSTENNDSPWMFGYLPLMGLDLWEHAYYLTYHDDRSEYIDAWWHVINWHNVEDGFSRAIGQ